MAKEEKEEVAVEEPVKKKKPLVKIIIIAVVVLVVVAGGVAGGLYYFSKAGTAKKAAAPPPPVIGALWPMEPFIVNLLDNQGERYLKIVLQLEVSNQLAVAELELLKPKLRDNVLDLLTAKTYSELMDMGGKQRLRDEIAVRINTYLTKGKIVKVYFTDFVIQ
jgi:flagellar FliL protein